MNIFLLNRNLEVVRFLSAQGDVNGISPFFNDKFTQYLETGADTFEFEMIDNEDLELCSYVVFRYKDVYKLFQIIDIQDIHEDVITKKVYCESAGLELRNDVLRPRSIPSANISQLLQLILNDTDWQLGEIDEDINDVHTVEIEGHVKVYEFLQEQIKKYECEISFRVEFLGNKVVGKYVDVFKQRGRITHTRFEYSKNLNSVERNVNAYELATSLIGVGKDNINFKEIEWSKEKGNPCNKPLGQDYVEDEDAFNEWNINGYHIMDSFECDSESPAELLLLTWKELQKRKTPKIDYKVEVAYFDDDIEIGDEIYVIDNEFANPLHLSARVNELTISFTDEEENECVFANYKTVESKIDYNMRKIVSELDDAINNTNFMGISKGGYLSSEILVDGFNINVKNKLVNEYGKEYFIDIRKKTPQDFILEKPNSHTSVTQSFAIDFKNNHIYAIQLIGGNALGNLILTKTDMNFNILGKMYLNNFGHGGQIGLSYENNKVYIWTECDGVLASNGSTYGTKICKFEFVNGKTVENTTGNVYDLIPGMQHFSVCVNQETNRLAIRCRDFDNNTYVYIYDYESVINNDAILISKIYLPSNIHSNKQPNQGYSVVGNYLYYYTGFGYDQTNGVNNTKLHCFDLKGNKQYEQLITYRLDMNHREAEGMYIRVVSPTQHEMYLGFASDEQGNRKYTIYKYDTVASDDYEVRGSFLHHNGHSAIIKEGAISTGFDGNSARKCFLLYVNDTGRFKAKDNFIFAEFKNLKWLYNGVEFIPHVNDAVIGEVIEKKNHINFTQYASNYESVKGQDGLDGIDAYTITLSNENHTFKCDNNGVISQSELSKFESNVTVLKGEESIPFTLSKGICTNCNISINGNVIKVTSVDVINEAAMAEVVIECENQTVSRVITLTKVKDGEDGIDSVVANLTNDNHTIPTDPNGDNGNYFGCHTQIELYQGENKLITGVTYGYSLAENTTITGRFDSNTGTYTVTALGSDNDYVDLFANYKSKKYTKRFTVNKSKNGADGYTVNMSNDSHVFISDSSGNIAKDTSITTTITAFKGVNSVGVTVGLLPTVPGLTLSKANNIITITAKAGNLLSDNGTFNIPVTVENNSFSKTFSWSKAKQGEQGKPGQDGADGKDGKDGTGVTIKGSLENVSQLPATGVSGDAYMINGDLYVWADNTKSWVNVGRIQGEDGENGANGQTAYIHIKYSNDGSSFTANDGETPGSWLGQYSDFIQADSMVFSKYTWKKIQGEDGKPGTPGSNAVVANLTNDSHTVPTDENGNNGNFSNCNTMIELYEGSLKITSGVTYSFSKSSSVVGNGNTSTGAYSVTGLTSDTGYVDLTATYQSKGYTKRFTISKSKKGLNGSNGLDGNDAYTISLSNDNHTFSAQNNGNIQNAITITTVVSAFKGVNSVTPTIGDLPSVSGLTLSKSGTTITIVAKAGTSLSDNGTFNIPITVDGKSFTKAFSWSKARQGNQGEQGKPGVDGKPGEDANLLDWVQDWDGNFVNYGSDKIIAPKIFAGTVTNNRQTGIAIGKDVFGTGTGYTGVVGYNNAIKTMHLDTNGSAMFGKSTNDPHIKFDAVNGSVSIKANNISIGSSSVATGDDVNNAISNVSIGNSNLHRHTDFNKDVLSKWYHYPKTNSETTLKISNYTFGNFLSEDAHIRDKRVLGLTLYKDKLQESGTDYGACNLSERAITLEVDTEYTFSYWVYKGGGIRTTHVAIWTDKTSSNVIVGRTDPVTVYTGSFVKKSITFKTATDTTKYLVRFYAYYDMSATNASGAINIYQPLLTKGNKVIDWSPCADDVNDEINNAQQTASNAQSNATSAQADANVANNKLNEISSDSKLTASEKKQTKKEWDIIVSEKSKIISEANKFGVSYSTYESRYNTLNSYITPLLSNLSTTSDIVGNTFRTNFKNYYDARQDVLNAITSKAKQLADNAQSSADSANSEIVKTNTKVSQITTDLSGITSRVETVETTAITNYNNLLINSNIKNGVEGWRLTNLEYGKSIRQAITSATHDDRNCIMLGDITNNTAQSRYMDSTKFPVTAGETVSISLNSLLSAYTDYVSVYLLFTDNTEDISVNNSYIGGYKTLRMTNTSWSKHSISDVAPAGATRCFVRIRHNSKDKPSSSDNNRASLNSIMVSRGDKFPSWTSNTDDSYISHETRLKSAEQKITDDAITSTVTSSQNWATQSNNIANAQSTANNALSSANTNASNLTNLTSRVNSAEQKITPEAITSTVTSSSTYKDDLTGKVSTNEIISSINQTAEAVKIKASKIQLEGAVSISNDSGDYVKINNADYEISNGGTTKAFFGLRQLDDERMIPRFAMGSNGLRRASDNYLIMQTYPANNNPQGYSTPYLDIGYRTQSFKNTDGYGDVQNIKMYGDGIIRVAPIKTFEITTNFKNGVYNTESESLIAEFGSSASTYYDKYMDIPTIRNTQTSSGLILAHRNANDQSCFVRVNCDTNGERFFRPLTSDKNVSLGSGGFPWKSVYSVATFSGEGVVADLGKSRNRFISCEDVIDNINFISSAKSNDNLIMDVTNIQDTNFIQIDESGVYMNDTEMIKLLLLEVKKLKNMLNKES